MISDKIISVGGTIVVVFGLFTMGLVKLGWLQRDLRLHPAIAGGHPLPVLGAILTMSAMPSAVSNGVALLSVSRSGSGFLS